MRSGVWTEEFKADDKPLFEVTYMSVFSDDVENILEWRL